MDLALSIQEYMAVEKERTKTNRYKMFDFPTGGGRIYLSNQFELGASEIFHYHEEPHMTLIVNGGVLDARKKTESERFSGELMFFQSGEIHRTVNNVFPTKYISLAFEADFFKKHSITESTFKSIVDRNLKSNFTVLKIYFELSTNDEFSATSTEMLLYNLIDDKIEIKIKRPNWLNVVHQLLNDNWNKDLSLNDLATVSKVHPKTVSLFFPKYFACTLGEYRRQLKITKAISLIKSSKLSLTEIAHECNFADQSHFIRTFKRLTGFLPKEFQKL